jgi:homoserine acetyltransferase
MTQNEIIELAKQAGLLVIGTSNGGDAVYTWPAGITDEIKAFAKLVAEKERAECWDIIFDYAGRDDITPKDESLLKHLADLIRARGQA